MLRTANAADAINACDSDISVDDDTDVTDVAFIAADATPVVVTLPAITAISGEKSSRKLY